MRYSKTKKSLLYLLITLIAVIVIVESYILTTIPYKSKYFQLFYHRLLLTLPSNINPKNMDIYYAISDADYKAIITLVKQKHCVLDSHRYRCGSPLHYSITHGDEKTVMILIAAGADLKGALRHAAMEGQVEIAKTLITKGVNLEEKSHTGKTPLHFAVEYGKYEMVKLLLENGAIVDSRDNYFRTPLHYASGHGFCMIADYDGVGMNLKWKESALNSIQKENYLKCVETLIKYGADVNTTTKSGRTPLHLAAENGCLIRRRILNTRDKDIAEKTVQENLKIINTLVQNGGNIEIKDKWGKTPLIVAIHCGNRRGANLLLEKGAKVYNYFPYCKLEKGCFERESSLLASSALFGMLNVAEAILSRGFKINKIECVRRTPLNYAVDVSHENLLDIADDSSCWKNRKIIIARLLVDHGLDVNERCKCGRTPLLIAVNSGFYEIIPLLVNKSACLECTDSLGRTPLHYLAKEKKTKSALEFLLQNGASPHIKDKKGKTPLDTAMENGIEENVEVLVKYRQKK